jgi:tRNA(Ile)-lysidine synthase
MLTTAVVEQILKSTNHHNKQAIYGLACSGGKDSIALAHIMHSLGLPIILMHCNFNLRGVESQRDQDFVLAFAKEQGIVCEHIMFDTEAYANTQRVAIQEAARTLRYNWFKEVLNKLPQQKKYLVTAHHANDNVETLLLNFFRGTGLKGLQGIPQYYTLGNIEIIRPLLTVSADDVVAYNTTHTLSWMHDSSNDTIKYERNFLRKEIIPQLEKRIPHFVEKLLGNIQRFNLLQQTLDTHIKHIEKQIALTHIGKQALQPNELALPIRLLQKLGLGYCMPYIETFGFTIAQRQEIEKLMLATNGKYCKATYGNYVIRKYNLWFIISPIVADMHKTIPQDAAIFIEKDVVNTSYTNGIIEIHEAMVTNVAIVTDTNTAMLDASIITWPLVLRPYKEGDYFYPLGMPKKKKLSRFFIDIKLPKEKRDKVWVLEANKKIIWVVGHRINDKFKVKPSTQHVLVIKIS